MVGCGIGRRFVPVLLVLSATFFLVSPRVLARSPGRTASILDASYAPALAAADRFLSFWQAGDVGGGIALLSSSAKAKLTADSLDDFFSKPVVAYEIARGKLQKDGRYEFPVVLANASKNGRSHRRFSSIIVVNTGDNDWAVDKLP